MKPRIKLSRGQKPELGVDRAAELLDEGQAIIVDVREPEEWRAGHIPGAAHIPQGELERRLFELPTDRDVIAVCRTGNRSAWATELLRQHGYRAMNLNGGMRAWERAGRPLEPSDGRVA